VNEKNLLSSPESRVVAMIQQVFDERSIERPVGSEDSLMDVGLTSLDTVKLVLLVENEFDLMLPLEDITPANFRSIASISHLVTRLLKG
jgi:acyl carrier protein